MINIEFRPDCSGIYEVSLENLQGWRPHKVSWATCSNAWLSLWRKLFLYLAGTSLISIYTHCLLFSYWVPLRRAWLHLLDSLHVGIGRLLLDPPKAVPSPGGTGPAPAGSPCRASALSPAWPNLLGCPSLWRLQLIDILLVLEDPKLDAAFQMGSIECWVQDINNHFPQSPGCAPVNAAWDAVGHLRCQDTLLAHV